MGTGDKAVCGVGFVTSCSLSVCLGDMRAAGEQEEQLHLWAHRKTVVANGISYTLWCARLVFAAQVLYELPTNMQWCFDIQWCPRNPAILSAASFDGRLSIYSIMGGSTDGLRQKHVDQVLRNMQLRKWLERGWSMGLWVAFGGCSNCMLAGVLICCERKK